MYQTEHFDSIAAKYHEFWNRENHDRPLLYLTVEPQPEANTYPGTLREKWLDTEFVLGETRRLAQNTQYFGEAYANAFPNLGPDIFGATLGCDLEFSETTSWATGHVESLEDLRLAAFDRQNFWYQKLLEMTRAMVQDAQGDYMVGISDLHAGMDGLVSMRGPENLCFDLYEEPELVKSFNFKLLDRFQALYNDLTQIIATKQKGTTNWMGVYHQKPWYVTSCDFMCMISPEMYQEFVAPELQEEVNFLERSIFHLDGPGALKHLDAILELDTLQGVQWVYGAGQPSAQHWVPTIRKIVDAGKCAYVNILPQDLPVLLDEIPPEGVFYRCACESAEEAVAMLKLADQHGGWKR